MTKRRSRAPSDDVLNAQRIVDLLVLRATDQPDEVVYYYLQEDGSGEPPLTRTYGQLFSDAQRVATLLLEQIAPGDRAILLFGSGLDFVTAFLGCQVAGVVPVPVMPPRNATPAELGRVMGIIDDVGTTLIVTRNELIQMGQAFFASSNLSLMSVENLLGVSLTPPVASEEASELALLQYTSGSTSRPRGVMVGHDNLMCNLGDIYWAEGSSPQTISVSWLPMSHDMGLIEGVLQPLYRGSPVYLMSPLSFLRRPLCWLEAISKYRATVSGGPNFAYELVLRRLGDGPPPDDLDLSCWEFAYNGSEPVSADTILAFSERLACRGFRPESIHPLFGIAEATLGVTEGRHQKIPRFQKRVDALGERTVVSCGTTADHTELVIVDPEPNKNGSHRRVPDGEEGEIWLNGPCVTRGYWRQPEKTEQVFHAKIEGSEARYLRTGDLGFLLDGELYVSGRIKEVIVSRGRNIFPQDMEVTAAGVHAMIRPGGVVAFRVLEGDESAGVVAEIDKKVYASGPTSEELERVAREIRRAVTLAHGVPIEVVALVKPGTIPRTTSGKRQRLRVAKMWSRDNLETLAVVKRRDGEHSIGSLEGYLLGRVAALVGCDAASIDGSKTLGELGVDSLRALELLIDVHAHFPDVSLTDLLSTSLQDLGHATGVSVSDDPWFEDAKLSDTVTCVPRLKCASSGKVLVTGATGFLGQHVMLRLLATTGYKIVALVRGENGSERLLESLRQHHQWRDVWTSRIEAATADLSLPGLGLDVSVYRDLAHELDCIYHIAAMVNWVYPYRALSAVNVEATRALIELACLATTPFVYVSTSAVCWSFGATNRVDESTDPLSHIDGIHLNYVRTKAVAESLVRQAGSRGLPATVVRPGLIFSHSETGDHTPGDFLSTLFKGCIEMGAAPDLDWALEVCPVDDVARVVVDHVRETAGVTTLHVEPPVRRLWRGAVLWMTLRGYSVELLDYADWCARLETYAENPASALRPLLSFFTRPVEGVGLRLPELYQECHRNPMTQDASRLALSEQPVNVMDARLLAKTFDRLVDSGYLPPVEGEKQNVDRGPILFSAERSSQFFETVLREHFEDPKIELDDVAELNWGKGCPGEHGIVGELSSWRHGRAAGVTRHRLNFRRANGKKETLSVVVKAQVPDHETLRVGRQAAMLCDTKLGNAWRSHEARSEGIKSHLREAAIYQLQEDALRDHRPVLYGTGDGVLVIEDLTGMPLLNSAGVGGWHDPEIAAAIEGIGAVHGRWFDAPPTDDWLVPRDCVAQRSLWEALADVATGVEAFEGGRSNSEFAQRYQFLLNHIDRWSSVAEELPQTLIHNDFNPRNVAMRLEGESYRLCAYDWELARVGIPQRDLAEFLCFTLAPDVTEECVTGWVEFHRKVVERRFGLGIEKETWRVGFAVALADFLVTRLPLYAMIGRFHPQPFLERVVRTWVSLDHMVGFER